MMQILRFWRDKSKESKLALMEKYSIKTITYSDIQKMYINENKKS